VGGAAATDVVGGVATDAVAGDALAGVADYAWLALLA